MQQYRTLKKYQIIAFIDTFGATLYQHIKYLSTQFTLISKC